MSLAAIDDNSFRVVLRQEPGFVLDALAKIGSPVPFMMPERLAKTDPFKQITQSIGSGPFRFVADDSGVTGSRSAGFAAPVDERQGRGNQPTWFRLVPGDQSSSAAFLDVALGFGSPALGLIAGWAGLRSVFLAGALLVLSATIIALRLLL